MTGEQFYRKKFPHLSHPIEGENPIIETDLKSISKTLDEYANHIKSFPPLIEDKINDGSIKEEYMKRLETGKHCQFHDGAIWMRQLIKDCIPSDTRVSENEYEIANLREHIKTLTKLSIALSKCIVYTEEEKIEYYEFECKCGFSGLSLFAEGGSQIADTGDYGDCYCPCCNSSLE